MGGTRMSTVAEQAYLNLAEAAEYTRLSGPTIRAAVYNDELPTLGKGKKGSKHLFARADLDAWMQSRRDSG